LIIPYLSSGKIKDTDNVEMKEINNDETQRTESVKAESFKTNGEEDTGGGDDSHHDDGHKMRRGQGWGKGIVADIKRTILTHWKGEMTNLNGKVSLYTNYYRDRQLAVTQPCSCSSPAPAAIT
jgi:hypothetical protein